MKIHQILTITLIVIASILIIKHLYLKPQIKPLTIPYKGFEIKENTSKGIKKLNITNITSEILHYEMTRYQIQLPKLVYHL